MLRFSFNIGSKLIKEGKYVRISYATDAKTTTAGSPEPQAPVIGLGTTGKFAIF